MTLEETFGGQFTNDTPLKFNSLPLKNGGWKKLEDDTCPIGAR